MQQKKFLIIGLGSMGKRRIRNLLSLGVKKDALFGFDMSRERCAEVAREYEIRTVENFKLAFTQFQPDVFIISTPPDKHAPYFLFAAKHKIHFFVEVTTVDTGYKKLLPLLRKNFIAAPSCTFRYVPGVLKIKEILENGAIGKPLSFQHYLGQYLPDWHPYEDYRKVYFAQKATGGAREMFPHELVWLSYLFGPVKNCVGINEKVSALEMTADDLYAAVVRFSSGPLGTVQVDLLNRHAGRTLLIVGTEGTLVWDWLKRTITLQKPDKKTEIINIKKGSAFRHYNTTEDIYRHEMNDFLEAVNGRGAFPYTYREDWAVLKALSGLEQKYRTLKAKKLW